ncbi:MAG: 2-succinyl-5-enolpyruvyl-6-hydroxy-3-cyclohexene-1-carboxylic-acid synthase [Cytophagales bacterium]
MYQLQIIWINSQKIQTDLNSQDYIYQIAEICAELGVENAIICPGSRSAPLAISFARNRKINCKLIFDERSAGYIGLGMAQQTKKTVVLICTSGTAALNFAPAVAEAYWQQIPLLVLTGDRPPEWIGQGDGQTINQNNIYHANCKASYLIPVDRTHKDSVWMVEKVLSEAIFKTTESPYGPVHINIPSREPFYPSKNSEDATEQKAKTIKAFASQRTLAREQWDEIIALLLENSKRVIIAGHQLPDFKLNTVLDSFQDYNFMPLLADVNSNLMGIKNAITNFDLILTSLSDTQKIDFQPDILISFGNEFVSKNLKQYLRHYKPKVHLHISENDNWVDTFQSVTHFVKVSPIYFFNELMNKTKLTNHKSYVANWLIINEKIADNISKFRLKNSYSEISIAQLVFDQIPRNSILHLSNSLPVRYANLLSIKDIDVYCNRGTSGIDGCVSTAVGSAMLTDKFVTLLSGDVAFLYDRNAFWHQYLPTNLRFVIINNGGGQIFRTIDGAKDQPELEAYFVGTQKQGMQFIAKEYNLEYIKVSSVEVLKHSLATFYRKDNKSKILEIEIDGNEALSSLAAFKNYVLKGVN